MGAKSALNAPRANMFLMDPSEIRLITDKTSALYDPRAGGKPDEALAKNIAYHGVLEPVICRKSAGEVQVVDGRRRVIAARRANELLAEQGLEPVRVPVILRRGDEEAAVGVMVSANELRLDDAPLAKAQKASKLLAMGKSTKEVALIFGVTVQCLGQWLTLLDTAPEVQAAVKSGKLAASAALEVAKLPREKQKAVAKKAEAAPKKTTATAVKIAQKTSPAPMRSRREIEDRLTQPHLPEQYRDALLWVLRKD